MGKARSFSDAANDTVYQTGINSENYVMGQQNTYNLVVYTLQTKVE